jgi:small conductance mechanosensitive channel
MNVDEILQKVSEYLAEYGLKVVGALAIFVVGRWGAKLLSRLTAKALAKARIDKTLVRFTENLSYVVLLVFVVVAALATAGVETTSFIAVLGAAGLAIGLALQGSLANFAAGVLMVIFKPMKVGDFVEIGGIKGTVQEIQIFNTLIDTPDNIRAIIPNAKVTSDNIKNYSTNGTRRVDLVIGVSYEDDLKKAQEVMERVLAGDSRLLKNPPAKVAVFELAESSVNFVVRPWVKEADYWDVYCDTTGRIKMALDDAGITMPFPQRDIHIKDGLSQRPVKS